MKAADTVLKKHPDHADTQAMKALILNSQGHRDEAFYLAKQALKCDMKSHICWHVYGLLYKDAKKFEESLKAYRFALKIEPDSLQIQRDLANLQMQMRDYPGYVQSRRTMLQGRPGLRMNWTALAVAQHLGGDMEGAENTLVLYEESLKTPPPKSDTEHQQAILYKNMIIAETGQTERALDHLNAIAKQVYDKQLVMELRAQYLLKLDRKSEAEQAYRALLRRNQENKAYYEGLQAAVGIPDSDTQALQSLYASCSEQYPKSDAPRRIPLSFLTGEDFRKAADDYLRRMLGKGVPSTFNNIKALYSDRSKQEIIQELAEGYHKNPVLSTENGDSETDPAKESANFGTSVLFFLAQHYNYHKSRDLSKAMEYIGKAIEQDARSVDFQMTKARILKHEGNVQKAAEVMDYARSLDERDRYINTKAAKYQLRNNENEKALGTMSKFTRQEATGGPLGDLIEMQSIWFLTEDGESYIRQNKLGLALKRFHSIYNVFDLWQEDQFDFHNFSLRKGLIRPYVDMVRWEDHLRDHPFYSRASIAATKAYLFLHDKPDAARGNLANGINGDHTDANQRKKAARKARRAQEKQEQLEAEKKASKQTAGGAEVDPKKEDKDPEGKQLLETQEPLKDSLKFLLPMLESSPKSLEAQKVGFEVFLRRRMYNFVDLGVLRQKLTSHRKISSSPPLPTRHQVYRARLSHVPQPTPPPTARFATHFVSSSSKSVRGF